MFLLLLQAVAMMVVSYALQMANKPRPQIPVAGTLDVPEPQPGQLVGVCFGTNVIKDANVIWYGDASTVPIKQKGGK